MKPFLSEQFLLESASAERLYHDYAAAMPIFDYHCHLPVSEIDSNRQFPNLTSIWLNGDHYKWRAMRASGVDEAMITGDADDRDKFRAWAATVPKTLRNPLYHWTHLELKRYFDIHDTLLSPATADEIFDHCSNLLQQKSHATRNLISSMNVAVICTTDDPLDSLEHHRNLQSDAGFPVTVLPAFRPDRAMAVEDPVSFNMWVDRLAAVCDGDIATYQHFIEGLQKRHDYFHDIGCRLSDHGLEEPYAEPFSTADVQRIFATIRGGGEITRRDQIIFKSAMLVEFGIMDHDRGWTQQFHFGALRNQNSKAAKTLGPDTGYDSIGDFSLARPLGIFLDRLNSMNKLGRTILYNINPGDNELLATMAGNFQDGDVPGKIQFGSGWWYNDQKDGMQRQINALSNMGLLPLFVGMLTDSRSFLSYPRHEYFRRVLCNLFGTDIEKGELPADFDLIGETIKDICFRNAVAYFALPTKGV